VCNRRRAPSPLSPIFLSPIPSAQAGAGTGTSPCNKTLSASCLFHRNRKESRNCIPAGKGNRRRWNSRRGEGVPGLPNAALCVGDPSPLVNTVLRPRSELATLSPRTPIRGENCFSTTEDTAPTEKGDFDTDFTDSHGFRTTFERRGPSDDFEPQTHLPPRRRGSSPIVPARPAAGTKRGRKDSDPLKG